MNISADTLLAIAVGLAGYMVFFNLVTALLAAIFRVPIERIQFGYPPSIRLFRIGQTEIRISPLLIGGHVKFVEGKDAAPYAPWPIRALLSIAAPIFLIAACVPLLGRQALDEALMTWPQIWTAVIDFHQPLDLDAALALPLAMGGLPSAAAIVAIKAAVFNLFPLPPFSGGAFLVSLLEGLTGKQIGNRLPQPILTISLAVMITVPLVMLWRIATGN
ncbi:MAG: hypothetical protein EOP61_26535 [Sphingomonadales bacterium]|nr:MAG: hypothetical protein EOP61_26535 [Sphingomonadales bacterium]